MITMAATQKQFLERLWLLAKVCEYQLNADLIALYDRALSRFGYDRAIAAVEEAVIERRGNERMPSIGDLVARCSPQILDSDSAVEVAGRILSAITKFGWSNGADAPSWIGEVGWAVVERNGGWKNLCETVKEKDIPTWRAQLRDQAGAVLRRHKAGVLHQSPKFDEVAGPKSIASLTAVVGKRLNSESSAAQPVPPHNKKET